MRAGACVPIRMLCSTTWCRRAPIRLISFLTILTSQQETEGTIKTWERLAQLHEKFQNRYLYEYVALSD